MKLNALLDDITKNCIFGKVAAFVYMVEFQKISLLHAHILIILKDHWKPRNSSAYDKFVSAEIPDPELFPELHATVTTCMIHGPCGRGIKSPCTGEDGVCSKRFPKAFSDETRRRRRPGPLDPYNEEGLHRPTSTRIVSRQIHHINATRSRRESVQVDNRWVIPYNPYLCQKYDYHVNVEVCSTVQSVKYLYKYVYKAQDRATVVLRERGRRDGTDENKTTEEREDEIKQYLDARYLSPPEGCWTIFKYEMQKNLITSTDCLSTMKTNSTLNGPGSDIARRLLYHEVSIHFVWVKMVDRYVWQPRQRDGDKAIGCLISVSQRDINHYYLRLLLCYRRGPMYFEDLKTVDNTRQQLYHLESDEESHRCLLEASAFQMPHQLRHLFAALLVNCEPASPRELWEAHMQSLCADF
ncbi:LOW QUALITY PROTEIN: Helitron helicase [Phytophthora megakarya]|uniref:Helitron helicase n=1 Tax=Phytophthora megakarya TaxID=4795 RepID=A0A225UYU1_9STRA|nr:LOW QUALITY PROTEIN: Helitron helicase [Phytophthora megakarya]